MQSYVSKHADAAEESCSHGLLYRMNEPLRSMVLQEYNQKATRVMKAGYSNCTSMEVDFGFLTYRGNFHKWKVNTASQPGWPRSVNDSPGHPH